jgi:hypothetical protein
VLYWPAADGGLWDPRVSALVESLEEALGVFVTCAGSGPGSLGLADAAAAARFVGCSSAVVIEPRGDRSSISTHEAEAAGITVVVERARWTETALIDAYDNARGLVTRAA